MGVDKTSFGSDWATSTEMQTARNEIRDCSSPLCLERREQLDGFPVGSRYCVLAVRGGMNGYSDVIDFGPKALKHWRFVSSSLYTSFICWTSGSPMISADLQP
jgi:hypothetical protein